MSSNITRFYYEDPTDGPPRLDQVFEDVPFDEADAHEEEIKKLNINYIRIEL
jgi:hypothetical protein